MALNKSMFLEKNLLDEKISIGTAQFGLKMVNNKEGKLSQSEINKIINFCIKKFIISIHHKVMAMLKIR